mgnify:CR=1 FL=1
MNISAPFFMARGQGKNHELQEVEEVRLIDD